MFNAPKQRSCFIIGLMKDEAEGDNARLIKLAREVITPLFNEIERRDGTHYVVRTPYNLPSGGKIMNDVLYAIDRADIVIADLTDSNANVFYELGICHALGRACIAVMEEPRPDRPQRIEFDISAFKVHKVNLDGGQFLEAQQRLREPLETAHRSASDWTKFENPVIDFFRAPITYISPAFSLARGYYLNFVKPAGESMMKRKGNKYLYDIGVAGALNQTLGKIEESRILTDEERSRLELHILIPGRLEYCRHDFVDRLRDNIPAAIVECDGRSLTCFAYTSQNTLHLVDVPTTMRTMDDAVDRRMRFPNTHHESNEWKEVEGQEIDRFALVLQMFISQHEAGKAFSQRIRVLRYDPAHPSHELLWFHNIVVGPQRMT